LQLVVGCDISEFRSYYEKTISGSDYRSAVGENDGITEMNYVAADLSHLILWKEGEQIMGHAIWHESNTDEHSKGVPRDEDDKRILRQLLGGRRDFVELHELWLDREHRGKGYGKQFFQFFENFISRRGHDALVHHAFDEAVAAICRQRGYKEKYGATAAGKTCWVFYLNLKK
jgi:GNAT superfamily N-acetyltransferase